MPPSNNSFICRYCSRENFSAPQYLNQHENHYCKKRPQLPTARKTTSTSSISKPADKLPIVMPILPVVVQSSSSPSSSSSLLPSNQPHHNITPIMHDTIGNSKVTEIFMQQQQHEQVHTQKNNQLHQEYQQQQYPTNNSPQQPSLLKETVNEVNQHQIQVVNSTSPTSMSNYTIDADIENLEDHVNDQHKSSTNTPIQQQIVSIFSAKNIEDIYHDSEVIVLLTPPSSENGEVMDSTEFDKPVRKKRRCAQTNKSLSLKLPINDNSTMVSPVNQQYQQGKGKLFQFKFTPDIARTLALPLSAFSQTPAIQIDNGNSDAEDSLIATTFRDDEHLILGSEHYNCKFNQLFQTARNNVPLNPCLNCTKVCVMDNKQHRKFVNAESKYPKDFLSKYAHIQPYKRRAAKLNRHWDLNSEKKDMVICVTCHNQLITHHISTVDALRRNFKHNHLIIPECEAVLASLNKIERNEISLIQPLGRFVDTQKETSYGMTKFISIETDLFSTNIDKKIHDAKKLLFGQIFHHPNAAIPRQSNWTSPHKMRQALSILHSRHSAYDFSNTFNQPTGSTAKLKQMLKACKTLQELELTYKALKLNNNSNNYDFDTMETDTLVVHQDTLFQQHAHLLNWKAQIPMVVFWADNIPKECIAFPYIFPDGITGTYSQELVKTLQFLQYIKIRSLCYDSLASLDRAYQFTLFCEKIKHLLFTQKIHYFVRKGAASKKQLLDGTVDKKMDGYFGFHTMKGIPIFPAYMKQARQQICSLVDHHGPPLFFVTLTPHPRGWDDLKHYLDNCWLFRDAPLSESQDVWDYDVNFTNLWIIHTYRAIRLFFRTKSFFGQTVKYKMMTVTTEFQPRSGMPHQHILIWLDTGINLQTLQQGSQEAEELAHILGQIIQTDEHLLKRPELQIHDCATRKKLCRKIKGKRQNKNSRIYSTFCKNGFPKIPIHESCIIFPLNDETQMTRCETKLLTKRILHALYDEANRHKSTDQFYNDLNISKDTLHLFLRSLTRYIVHYPKRSPKDWKVNPFIPIVANNLLSNMDVQAILSYYRAIRYVTKYTTKAIPNRGKYNISNKRLVDGQITLQNYMERMHDDYANSIQVSIQHASWLNQGLGVVDMTHRPIPVNVSGLIDDLGLLKHNLTNVDEDSTNIYAMPEYILYCKRPNELNYLCFADWITNFQGQTDRRKVGYLFEISFFEQGEIKTKQYFNRKQKGTISFYFFPLKQGSKARTHYIFFHPWRHPDEITDYFDCSVQQQELIQKNWNVHRSWTPFFFPDNVEMEISDIQSSSDSDDSDSDRDRIIDGIQPVDIKNVLDPNQKQLLLLNLEAEMRKLNDEQAFIVAAVANSLDLHNIHLKMLIQGKAGVGKSFIINVITAMTKLKRHTSRNPVRLCAPTGFAAHNIGGGTLHHTFRIGYGDTSIRYHDSLPAQLKMKMETNFKDTEVVILDEFSMCGLTKLSQIDSFLRKVKNCDDLFGGTRVLAFGDFNQMPPVRDRSPLDFPFFFENFSILELFVNHRQLKDLPYAIALQNFADGKCTEKDISFFHTLKESFTTNSDIPEEWMHLPNNSVVCYKLNNTIDKFHDRKFQDDNLHTQTYMAKFQFRQTLIEDQRKVGPNQIPIYLKLQIGAKVMLMRNKDVRKGLVNGCIGVVESMETTKILINFGGRRVYIQRQPLVGQTDPNFLEFIQFPLRLAYALTSYKVQGQTITGLVRIDGFSMRREEVYVCLSRSTDSKFLRYINISDDMFKIKGPCNTMQRVRDQILHQPSHQLYMPKDNHILRIVLLDQGCNGYLRNNKTVDILNGLDFFYNHRIRLLNPNVVLLLRPRKQNFTDLVQQWLNPLVSRFSNTIHIFGADKVLPRRKKNDKFVSLQVKELKVKVVLDDNATIDDNFVTLVSNHPLGSTEHILFSSVDILCLTIIDEVTDFVSTIVDIPFQQISLSQG